MLSLVFWNTYKRELSSLIAALARDVRANLIVLAEYPGEVGELITHLNSFGRPFFEVAPGFPDRLTILSSLPSGSVLAISDGPGVSIRHCNPPLGESFILTAVHLPSKMYQSNEDQLMICSEVASSINAAEQSLGHSRTIVIGDFNINPFEPGMYAAGGLHAVMDRSIANKLKRTVQNRSHSFFYNPMWAKMGDLGKHPPGTYFYNSGRYMNLFWNVFDQVLLRPAMLHLFTGDSVEVVTSIREHVLLNEHGHPDKSYSDHLPIVLRLFEIAEGDSDGEKLVG